MSRFARLRNVFRSRRLSDEIDREMAFHLAERTDDLIARGLDPDAARFEAQRRFGNYALQKEHTRDRDVLVWLETLLADLRYALRALRAAPGFALVAIVSLALGIGANSAIFNVVNAVMLRSLPYARADELVILTRSGEADFSDAEWEVIRDHQDVLAGVFAYASTHLDLGAGGDARAVPVGFVSGDFFHTLGVRAAAGRTLARTDDRRGCPGVAVISHALWQSEYGGRGVVGTPLPLDGYPFEIVGVADPAFFGVEVGYHVPVWVPLCAEALVRGEEGRGYSGGMGRLVVGRLGPGVTVQQARARLAALAPALPEPGPSRGRVQGPAPSEGGRGEGGTRAPMLGVSPFSKGIPALRMDYGQALVALLAVVGVVLLIACANVANLLLARATARRRETAIRLALGASRSRLVRQLLTESVLLSLLGAAAGVLLAVPGSYALVGFMSTSRHAVSLDLTPDLRVLAFTIAVGMLTGVVFGLAPALRAIRTDPHAALKPSAHGAGARWAREGRSRFGLGKALVVGQIALSLVALVGASLLLGSWRRLATLDPGFRRDHVLLVEADIRAARLPDEQRGALYRRVVERLRRVPGVREASAAARTPIGPTNWGTFIEVPGFTARSDEDAFVQLNEVTDRYFRTIGTPILAGRDFGPGDVPTSPRVAIVNEELARRFFGGSSAIGKRFKVQLFDGTTPTFEVVGVSANTKQRSLREVSPPIVYFGLGQETRFGSSTNFVLRTQGPPAALAASVKAAIAELDPRFSLAVVTLEQQLDESLRLPRTLALLSGFFGALALLLATVGLYGLVSYTVARRRNEIGIRIALGAARGRVLRMVLGDVGRMVAAGVVIGTAASLAVTRLVSAFLYAVEPDDPPTMALATLTLVTAAVGAALVPAWHAARLDPAAVLRED